MQSCRSGRIPAGRVYILTFAIGFALAALGGVVAAEKLNREQKRVVYDKVRLAQEFRTFDFLSPWEGPDYPLPGDEKANSE